MAARRLANNPHRTPAIRLLAARGVAFTVHAYDHDPRADSYGLEAATELGLDPARVFKTLVVSGGPGLGVGVVPVDRQLDLKAVARVLGWSRATMADPQVAARSSGYVVGGISPLAHKRPLPTVIDDSAERWETVFVSAGQRGLDVELAPEHLAEAATALFAPISR